MEIAVITTNSFDLKGCKLCKEMKNENIGTSMKYVHRGTAEAYQGIEIDREQPVAVHAACVASLKVN